MDWDSPSHETGTVKRRPASLSASFSASNNHFENIEYYELRDCIGGYGLKLLESTGLRSEDPIAADISAGKDEGTAVVKSNGNCSRCPRSSRRRKKDASSGQDDNLEKFKAPGQARRAFANDPIERAPSRRYSRIFKDMEDERWKNDTYNEHSRTKDRKSREIKDETDRILVGCVNVEDVHSLESSCEKVEARKDFGLKLTCESFEWKSTVCRVTKIRRSESLKFRSLIPRPKVGGFSRTRGLVSSSSESSGFGSPLSPLSPQQDPSISTGISKDAIKTSDSKSSGLGSPGSPGSPLSPESQQYSAFHLIQLQLEKLRNCPCEERQAKVIRAIMESLPGSGCA